MARFNNLFFYFIVSQLIFLPIYFYSTPLIATSIDTHQALGMHVIGLFWAAVGYCTAMLAHCIKNEPYDQPVEDKTYAFGPFFYFFSYALIIIGTVVAVLQIALFVPLGEYFSKLFVGDFEAGIRDAYLLSFDEGGLPGIIKMFAFAPLSIYLMSLGLINFVNINDAERHRLKIISLVALGAIIIKIMFSLDRLTIMAVLLANLFLVVRKGYLHKLRYWMLIALTLIIAHYLSLRRLENFGIFDFVLLYFKLGLVNFQWMIATCSQYTYGFSTILSPLSFVFKFLDLPFPEFMHDYVWEWNPAQYFSSYAFQDFGYFYFVSFYVLGVILYVLNTRTHKQHLYSSAVYFVVLYGVVSFIFVPAIRGMEFWLALCIPLVLLKINARSQNDQSDIVG